MEKVKGKGNGRWKEDSLRKVGRTNASIGQTISTRPMRPIYRPTIFESYHRQ